MPPSGPMTASGAHVFPLVAHDGSEGKASCCCFHATCNSDGMSAAAAALRCGAAVVARGSAMLVFWGAPGRRTPQSAHCCRCGLWRKRSTGRHGTARQDPGNSSPGRDFEKPDIRQHLQPAPLRWVTQRTQLQNSALRSGARATSGLCGSRGR